jgi:ABC-type transport system involved in cytochrome c biogenesis ATPase subunit
VGSQLISTWKNPVIFFRVSTLPNQLSQGVCYLRKDNWDDFGFKTTFQLHYCSKVGDLIEIGSVKIMSNVDASPSTDFESVEFPSLPDHYCSLGIGQGYYEELMGLSIETRIEILVGLRDCVYDHKIYEMFRVTRAFQTSLVRSVQESDIKLRFHSILTGNAVPTTFKFSYKVNTQADAIIDVSVVPASNPPSNIHVLIGRNGVGKTRLLAGICDALAGVTDNDFGLAGTLEFSPPADEWIIAAKAKIGFANVVTIAFSAFDSFVPLSIDSLQGDMKYSYVGLRREDKAGVFKTPEDLQHEFAVSLKHCLDGVRKARWLKAISGLHTDPIFEEYDFPSVINQNGSLDDVVGSFTKLSSGHKIILLSLTRLVQLVDERTLVLIDEPENHLHPPLLSAYIRALSELVISRNGVALIATHSPVVLQEVPSSCVTIIDKIRSVYRFTRPELETFAENVGTLTRQVFDLEVTNSGYHSLIAKFLQNHSYEELLEAYHRQIGAEGRTLARIISKTIDQI